MRESITERIDYENRGAVGIWYIDGLMETLNSGELEEGEAHFRETAGQPSMSACVVVLEGEDDADLGSETLGHVNEKWTELGEATGMKATAYVSDGIAKLAISQKNEAEGVATRGFDDVEAGVEWAAAQ